MPELCQDYDHMLVRHTLLIHAKDFQHKMYKIMSISPVLVRSFFLTITSKSLEVVTTLYIHLWLKDMAFPPAELAKEAGNEVLTHQRGAGPKFKMSRVLVSPVTQFFYFLPYAFLVWQTKGIRCVRMTSQIYSVLLWDFMIMLH